MKGAISRAHELVTSNPNAIIRSNSRTRPIPMSPPHHSGGNLERYRGKVDIVVSGVGTGGTINRRRPSAEVKKARCEDDRTGTGGQPGTVGRRAGTAQKSKASARARASHSRSQSDRRDHHYSNETALETARARGARGRHSGWHLLGRAIAGCAGSGRATAKMRAKP